MKTIKEQNIENEKIKVGIFNLDMEPIKYIPFNMIIGFSTDNTIKVESGRGGELLKVTRQSSPGLHMKVKCSKTKIKGKLFWKHALKNTISRIEWEDGVIEKY